MTMMKIVYWASLVVYCIVGLAVVGYAIFTIPSSFISGDVGGGVGELIGSLLFLFFFVGLPVKLVWSQLKFR